MTTAQAPAPPATGWRTALPTRLATAALIGALTGTATSLTGHLMPFPKVPVNCHPAGGLGCAIAAPITSIVVGALLWLAVVCAATYGTGLLLTGLCVLVARVPIGITAPLAWPVMLWAIAVLLKPVGVTIDLKDAGVVGYLALALTLTAALTAPQIRLTARLVASGVLACAVVIVLLV